MNYKVSGSKIILFIVLSSIFFTTAAGFELLIDSFSNSSWVALIFVIIQVVLILLLYKPFPEKYSPLRRLQEHKLIKAVLTIYLLLSIIMQVILSSLIIKQIFYQFTPIALFMLIIIAIGIFLSFQSFKCIIDTGVLFYIICVIIYIIPLFLMESRIYELLLPIEINISKIYVTTLFVVFPLDSIIFLFYNPSIKKGLKRRHLIIASVILLCYFLFILVDSITLLGAEYLKGASLGGFYRWKLFTGNRFLENNDILLLLITSVSVIYKIAIQLNLLRLIHNMKAKKIYFPIILVVLFLLSFSSYLFFDVWKKNLIYLLAILLVLILTVYIYILKETYLYIKKR